MRFVELSNKGAKEMGFEDTGAMWRAKYDMEPDAFAAEMERLWQQVKPLYDSLYTYTRRKLSEKYGKDVVPEDKPIPAHLLGNMWAQHLGQCLSVTRSGDCRSRLRPDADTEERETLMRNRWFVTAKSFFTSLGFEPCRQLSGNDRCLLSRRIAKLFVTRARGTSTLKKMCG